MEVIQKNPLKNTQNNCLSKIEDKLEKDNSIAAFVMESGAQMAGGVIIYPKNFQKESHKYVKKMMFCLYWMKLQLDLED